MSYNSDCHAVQNTRALCFSSAARDSQSNIVGKVPSTIGIRSVLAVPRDNGSATCEGHFAMDKHFLIYLYMYQNNINGKAYIGVTKKPKDRFKNHAKGKSSALAFNRAVAKYGIDSFDFRYLAVFDDIEAANYHENAAISAFGTLSPNGYNLIGGAPKSKYFGPMSQEVKDKIGKANRKNKLTKEHLLAMNNAKKGLPSWNKGKTMSSEHCVKLSTAHKGVSLSQEHIANMSEAIKRYWANKTPEQMDEHSRKVKEQWAAMTPEKRAEIAQKTAEKLTGKPLSPEHCAKLSENTKRYLQNETPEHRANRLKKQSESLKGHSTSPETRAKISRANMGNKNSLGKHMSPETLLKMSIAQKGKIISPEQREKISMTLTGRNTSKETREKLSASMKEWWKKKKAEASNAG